MRDLIEELKALADPSRLRIVSLIWEAEDLCSCEIENILDLKQSNASRHLYRLRTAGLLDSYKKAQWMHYTMPEDYTGEHGGSRRFLQEIILTAREEQEIFNNDLKRFHDYRDRGFTCATIHQWVPFKYAG
ncbi:MAG: ArsR/SmtB family transcription factor [Spirochaetaceae bacterium]